MDVGNSIRKALEDYDSGELDPAMLHACNAIDGTAGKVYPNMTGNAARFKKLLRQNCTSVIEPMVPGVNLVETVFPVNIENPTGSGGRPDFADIIYVIHRCNHNHGAPLPIGFELMPDAGAQLGGTRMTVEKNLAGHWVVRFSDRVIFGMLAVALLSPANADQRIPDGCRLTYSSISGDIQVRMDNDWWGRVTDFSALAAMDRKRIRVTLDFSNVMPLGSSVTSRRRNRPRQPHKPKSAA